MNFNFIPLFFKFSVKYVIIIFLLSFSIIRCENNSINKGKLLAEVYSNYFYEKDLSERMPKNLTPEDSLKFKNKIISQWIETKLILHNAHINLSSEEKDISEKIENYANFLLIQKYKQKLIKEKLNTDVSISELKEYYDKYTNNFILKRHIVKALFIKISNSNPQLNNIRILVKSKKDNDFLLLENYCTVHADIFQNYDENWIYFETIDNQLPEKLKDKTRVIKNNYFETTDSAHIYFLQIYDYRLPSDFIPFSFVENDIKNIIINKRKIKFAKQLEKNIYNEAKKNNKFKIY